MKLSTHAISLLAFTVCASVAFCQPPLNRSSRFQAAEETQSVETGDALASDAGVQDQFDKSTNRSRHPESLLDTTGGTIPIPETRLTVYCFLGTECPLAKLYGPRLQALSSGYGENDVAFIGINSNVQDSPSEIDQYARRHRIRFPIAKDARQAVADRMGATRTPEVVLLDANGLIQYRGRIDDQYEPGIARQAPRSHDLRNAIDQYLAGEWISVPETEAVGCLITRVAKRSESSEEAAFTFTRDIKPILNQHCVECHRPGEIGPFSLTDYDEVIGWAEMMLEVIDEKRMPPWHAEQGIGEFIGARVLPSEARETISRWIEDGMPKGEESDLPPAPVFTAGWHLPTKPDLELAMRPRPFTVPADGVVEYQYFVVDPGWETDRWVRAAQVIPGDASVVHHTIVFVRPPDGTSFGGIGWLGAYVPGQRTLALPAGHARRIPAKSKLVFQMHYTPNGTESQDRTRLGIWFADEKTVTDQVTTHVALNHEFEIPPGESDFRVTLSSDSFPHDGMLLGITPHMHFRGKSFRLFAKPKANEESRQPQEWLRVPHYDFNWQHWYAFSQPKSLQEIESLEMSVGFDNSMGNPFNPDPEEFVSWGDQTWEEMAVAFYDIATPLGSPLYRRPTLARPSDQQLAERRERGEAMADQFFAEMDLNGDGVVQRDETPDTFRAFGFYRLDLNRDRRITRSEVL
ncbi:MAG: redoxin domain-containing protein, partial [Planctomycetota bacterium]